MAQRPELSPGPIEWHRFHRRYGPQVMKSYEARTRRLGKRLERTLGHKRVLGVALVPHHDETTVWWFEQTLLAVMAAAGWDVFWVTDTTFEVDRGRLDKLPGRVRVCHVSPSADLSRDDLLDEPCDVVVASSPHDVATRAAKRAGVPLAAFAVKNLYLDMPDVQEAPPPGTRLWHAFAGSRNFLGAAQRTMSSWSSWEMVGAPFPVCHHYFPLRTAPIRHDALLFGSQGRQLGVAMSALASVGVERVAALVSGDADAVRMAASAYGLELQTYEPQSHLELLELLEATRVVMNPIAPPAESHYTMSVPLAVGRPIIASDLPSVAPFVGDGVRVASLSNERAWATELGKLLDETSVGMPHRGAWQQGLKRHDAERFFASALLETLGAI